MKTVYFCSPQQIESNIKMSKEYFGENFDKDEDYIDITVKSEELEDNDSRIETARHTYTDAYDTDLAALTTYLEKYHDVKLNIEVEEIF